MNEQDIHALLLENNEGLKRAEQLFMEQKHTESLELTNQIISSLLPFEHKTDIGDIKDKDSLIHKIIDQLAHAYNRLQTIYNELNDWAQALQSLQASMEYAKKVNNHLRIIGLHCNMGILYYKLGDFNLAAEYFQLALEEAETFPGTPQVFMGNIFTGTASIHLTRKNYALAEEHFLRALNIFRALGILPVVCNTLNNLGALHFQMKNYRTCIRYFNEALQTNEQVHHASSKAMSFECMGQVYIADDNPERDMKLAEECFLKSEAILKEAGLPPSISSFKGLARSHKEQKNFEKALSYTEEAADLDKKNNDLDVSRKAQLFDYNLKTEAARHTQQLKEIRAQEQEKILLNILPAQIAERILEGEKQIADTCDEVSVFFCDIVGFTKLSQNISAHELVSLLNEIFSEFDRLAIKHGLEKIKTIGDAYMAVAGVPVAQENHAERAALFAIDVMNYMSDYRNKTGKNLEVRAGLHSGHAVAGIIGENKFAYDLWGDAVNTASRMESHGEPGKIQVSNDFKNKLNGQFTFEERGEMDVKGKGMMKTFFLNQQK